MEISTAWAQVLSIIGAIFLGSGAMMLSARWYASHVNTLVQNFKAETREDIAASDKRWAKLFESFHLLDKDIHTMKSRKDQDI